MKKKMMTKVISCTLACTMVMGCCAMVLASPEDMAGNQKMTVQAEVKEETKKTSSSNNISNVIDNTDADKEETVYVITKSDGTVDKVIVSELLKNPEGKDKLDDATLLSDIVNVKSDAAYALNGTSCVWDAGGENIYYRGTTSQEIPVSFKMSFKLDGKSVSAEDMDGATGHMEMKVSYINNLMEDAVIDGNNEKIAVPFVMMSGMVFNNENFRHATVDNGKIIDDGDKSAVVGFAVPGLADDLDVTDDSFPSEFTINADVSDFEMPTVVTAATNDVFSRINIDDDDTLSDIEDKLELLDSSMKQIVDGSSELYGYLNELLTKSDELVTGVRTLTDYAEQISGSVDKLYNEGIVTIDGKLKELNSGLNTLSSNSATLNGGAKQVYDTLIATVQSQIAQAGLDQLGIEVPILTPDNYGAELDKLIAELDENSVRAKTQAIAGGQVKSEVEKNTEKITEAVTAKVREQVTAAVNAKVKEQVTEAVTAKVREQVAAAVTSQFTEDEMESDEIKAVISSTIEAKMAGDDIRSLIEQNISGQMESDDIRALIEKNINDQMNSDAIKATIDQNVSAQKLKLIDENMSGEQVQTQIEAAVQKASSGAQAIKSAKSSLDSYKTFYQGVLTYTAGVDTAASGSAQLAAAYSENITANMKTLNDKLKEYVNGMHDLNSQVPALKDAVSQLTDGAKELSEGSSEFYTSGIKELVNKADDVIPVIDRLKAAINAAKDYQSFGGKSDDMTGSVKFIYRTN